MIKNLDKIDFFLIIALTLVIINASVSFTVFDFLQTISYAVWGMCCLCFIIMIYLFSRKPLISLFDASVIGYFFILILFTFLSGTDIKSAVYKTIEVFLFLMVLTHRHNLKLVLNTSCIVLSACTYLNLLIMILFPNWMFVAKDVYDSYLLGGNYNQIGCRLICAVVISCLCIMYSKKWLINTICLFAVSITTLALVGSMTSLSCIILFAVFCIVPSLKLQKIGTVLFFVFIVAFQCIVVFSGEGLHNNPYAVYLIEDVLQKDLTFTNRTSLWDAAGTLFSKSPVIGYGFVDGDWYLSEMSSFAIGPHNFIYSVLINGGITLLSLFLFICFQSVQKCMSNLDRYATILLFGILSMFFMMQMEVYPYFFVFMLLSIAYYLPSAKQKTLVQTKKD